MNTKQVLLVFILALYHAQCQAQFDKAQEDSTIVLKHKLWLYNSAGQVVADGDSVVSKEYFNTKWVDLQSGEPYTSRAKFICILQSERRQAMAYYLPQNRLTAEVIDAIRNREPGGRLMFIVEEKNEETGVRYIRGLNLTLN